MAWVFVVMYVDRCHMTTINRAIVCLGCHATYVYTHGVIFCCHVCCSMSHDSLIHAMWHHNIMRRSLHHAAALSWIYVTSYGFFYHFSPKCHVCSVLSCDRCLRLSCKQKILHDNLKHLSPVVLVVMLFMSTHMTIEITCDRCLTLSCKFFFCMTT
jgi:hypothetical protein